MEPAPAGRVYGENGSVRHGDLPSLSGAPVSIRATHQPGDEDELANADGGGVGRRHVPGARAGSVSGRGPTARWSRPLQAELPVVSRSAGRSHAADGDTLPEDEVTGGCRVPRVAVGRLDRGRHA